MIQHQIPQNVTKYEFGLIGGVTPRQFIEAASGIVVGLIIQYLFVFIPSYIRTPIAIGLALIGVAFTFLKYEERTLDTWFINFLKSIYSPTEYVWKRNLALPSFFAFVSASSKSTHSAIPQKTYHPFQSNPAPIPEAFPLSEEQEKNLNQIHNLFNAQTQPTASNPILSSSPQTSIPAPQHQNPILKKLPSESENSSLPIDTNINTAPISVTPSIISMPAPLINLATNPPSAISQAVFSSTPKPNPTTTVNKPTTPQLIHKAPSLAPALKIKSIYKDKNPKSIQPEFASDIDIPITNESPNIITGITLDDRERLISNVIVEITDENNLPVRAVKSNKLSQFFIASPLKNGHYQIKAQHPDYVFAKIDIKADGQIIPPVKIIGKAK